MADQNELHERCSMGTDWQNQKGPSTNRSHIIDGLPSSPVAALLQSMQPARGEPLPGSAPPCTAGMCAPHTYSDETTGQGTLCGNNACKEGCVARPALGMVPCRAHNQCDLQRLSLRAAASCAREAARAGSWSLSPPSPLLAPRRTRGLAGAVRPRAQRSHAEAPLALGSGDGSAGSAGSSRRRSSQRGKSSLQTSAPEGGEACRPAHPANPRGTRTKARASAANRCLPSEW
mmetsp:Transcript_4901/g.12023  ORF Transcript_4901/g.12023 Transcript_4901/m.12023 type:complete len:232 (-) Transcript_4901:469-1164(-)